MEETTTDRKTPEGLPGGAAATDGTAHDAAPDAASDAALLASGVYRTLPTAHDAAVPFPHDVTLPPTAFETVPPSRYVAGPPPLPWRAARPPPLPSRRERARRLLTHVLTLPPIPVEAKRTLWSLVAPASAYPPVPVPPPAPSLGLMAALASGGVLAMSGAFAAGLWLGQMKEAPTSGEPTQALRGEARADGRASVDLATAWETSLAPTGRAGAAPQGPGQAVTGQPGKEHVPAGPAEVPPLLAAPAHGTGVAARGDLRSPWDAAAEEEASAPAERAVASTAGGRAHTALLERPVDHGPAPVRVVDPSAAFLSLFGAREEAKEELPTEATPTALTGRAPTAVTRVHVPRPVAEPVPEVLSRDEVLAVVLANRDELVDCVHALQARNPELHGMLTVRWNIRPSGSTSGVTVETDELADSELARCARQRIARWKFPVHQQQMGPIRVPFTF